MGIPRQLAQLLSPSQQTKISNLVRLHHYALIIELLGDKAVPPHIVTQVRTAGLYRKPRPDVINRSYIFGKATVLEPDLLEGSEEDLDRFLEEQGIVLHAHERDSLELLRRSFGSYLESLATDMIQRVQKSLLKTDRKLQRKLAQRKRRELFLELEKRKALADLAKDLTEITTTEVGNAVRIIQTETNNAFQDGRAQEIIRKSGEDDPLVFKQPRHDACPECVKAYLGDDGVTPRVFKLSELVDNGSNIGKSRADRLPVLDSYHPHCACMLFWLPPGFGFDANGTMVYEGTRRTA